jgi:hypothetical protein
MYPFEEYLKQHQLEALTVSLVAQVRYVTVWNATKGNPITLEHARSIRQAAFTLTRDPYTGPLVLLPEREIDQSPTLPVRRFLDGVKGITR